MNNYMIYLRYELDIVVQFSEAKSLKLLLKYRHLNDGQAECKNSSRCETFG